MNKITYNNFEISSEIFTLSTEEIIKFASMYDPMFFHMDKHKAEESIFKELVASGMHSVCIILQKIDQITPWKIATGLEHTVKYFKPVKPSIKYFVQAKVVEESKWKNPKYSHLKMENSLRNENNEIVVLLNTSFLIYSKF
ncbi:MAG: MaoC/PaaZ C-terminal domain-containing protein [Candidatus Marinimicrobia bacterium]|nr:MaoC/PaaZ C-terminal domain-containing protein [Candidatus Neomarinimicrobiota bacterium]